MSQEPIPVYVLLNARLMPIDRGELYEDPLIEEFEANGLGEVTGGGTMQAKSGEIDYCGIDVDVFDLEKGIEFLLDFFKRVKAPRGSKLQYRDGETEVERPFGVMEGLALYLNGTDLPAETYRDYC